MSFSCFPQRLCYSPSVHRLTSSVTQGWDSYCRYLHGDVAVNWDDLLEALSSVATCIRSGSHSSHSCQLGRPSRTACADGFWALWI